MIDVKPKVYITRKLPSPGIELLLEYCDIVLHPSDAPPSHDEIIANLIDKDGLLCLLTDRIDKDIIDTGKKLRVISTYSAGFEHIDVAEATKKGIYIGYTPDVLTEATADLTFALMLATARRITEAERLLRAGDWKIAWSPTFLLGESVWGRTLGIVGSGRIGKAVAKRARGFAMKIFYNDVEKLSELEEEEYSIEFRELDELLRESDFVTIHTPLTKDTYHLINDERLKMMKPDAILINTSRGPTVDEEALVRALREKRIGGAGLDVYMKEPIAGDNPLLSLENVVLLPHIGSATREARSKMAEVAAKNLVAVLKGEPPLFWVNSEVEKVNPLAKVKMI